MTALARRVALVTGASSGIGAAIATTLAADGATVVGFDLAAGDDPVPTIACDVADTGSVEGAVAEVVARHGRVDIAVNVAGIWRPGDVVDTSVDEWDATMAVNVRGPFLVSKAVVPEMRAGGGGVIVHVASISGLTGDDRNVAYVASKGAVISMTRAMAIDHAPDGIRVVSISPGMTRTPMLDATEAALEATEAEALKERRIANIPLGRLGATSDIAEGVRYLVSDAAAWVTGTNLTVDGGTLAGRAARRGPPEGAGEDA